MKIAILGATSQIARDLINSMSETAHHELHLYSRRPSACHKLPTSHGFNNVAHIGNYESFRKSDRFDALINFVGVGNPAAVAQMGADIFDVTLQFDELALSYIRAHPQCRYIFLSSGAVYGSNFSKPVDQDSTAVVSINNLRPQDWYGAAKLAAECRHRAHTALSIIDIRIFNYFSASQDLNAGFLICDILRAIRDHSLLTTSPENIVRDYISPSDFFRLIDALLNSPMSNDAVDSYSRSPIDKITLLTQMKQTFGLNFEILQSHAWAGATGFKENYYSLNTRASEFGYEPRLNSIEGIIQESKLLLDV